MSRVAQGNFTPRPSQIRTWQSPVIRLLSPRRLLQRTLPYRPVPPVTGWPNSKARWSNPFAPSPSQRLLHYYELVRPRAPHRYSHSRGSSTSSFSLRIGTIPPRRDCTQKPESDSRYLYAGRRPSSKQVSLGLILEFGKPPVLTSPYWFRHLISSSLALASLILTWHFSQCLFLQRSPQGLLTHATWGGLKPAPVSRLRGAYPHLLCNFVAHLPIQIKHAWLKWLVVDYRKNSLRER